MHRVWGDGKERKHKCRFVLRSFTAQSKRKKRLTLSGTEAASRRFGWFYR